MNTWQWHRPRTVFIATGLIYAVLAMTWALASPLFSVPDENAHITKAIALVNGQVEAKFTSDGTAFVDLPAEFSYNDSLVCYVRDADKAADCAPSIGDPGGKLTFPSWVANYNPLYYALVAWPTRILNGDPALYAMRAASVLISSLFVAAAAAAAQATTRARWMPLGTVFAAAPMTIYFVGAVNPQGLEITAAMAAFTSALGIAERSTSARARWWVLHAISAVALMNVRATGPLWYALIIGAVVLVVGWRPIVGALACRNGVAMAASIGLGAAGAVAWLLHVGQLSQAAVPDSAPLIGASFLRAAAATASLTPGYLEQAMGVFGWLDTALPASTFAVAGAAFLAPLIALAVTGRRRQLVQAGALCLVALAIPVAVQGWAAKNTGLIWQGRYAAFFYLAVGLAVAWLLGAHSSLTRRTTTRLVAVTGALLGIFGVFSFTFTMSRYATGLDEPITHVLTSPQWQPPGGTLLMIAAHAAAWTAWVVLMRSLSLAAASGSDPVEAAAPIR